MTWLIALIGPSIFGFVAFGWRNAAATFFAAYFGAMVFNLAFVRIMVWAGRYTTPWTLRISAILSMLFIGMATTLLIG